MNKKAQGQIITTILIILLVLAAIVIVWQVVNRTVTEGGEEVTAQSKCLGFSVTIGTPTDGGVVNGYPSKAVTALTFYKNGDALSATSGALAAGVSHTTTDTVATGDVITASGMVDGQLCPGMNSVTVP